MGDLLVHLVNLHSLALVQVGPDRLLGSSCPPWILTLKVLQHGRKDPHGFQFCEYARILQPSSKPCVSDWHRYTKPGFHETAPLNISSDRGRYPVCFRSQYHATLRNVPRTAFRTVLSQLLPRLVSLHIELRVCIETPAWSQLLSGHFPNLRFLWLQLTLQHVDFVDAKVSAIIKLLFSTHVFHNSSNLC